MSSSQYFLLLFLAVSCQNSQGNPLDFLKDEFQIQRPFFGADNSSFYCQLAKSESFKTCSFITPQNKEYSVQENGVIDVETNTPVENVEAILRYF